MPILTDEIVHRVLPEIVPPPRVPEGVSAEAVARRASELESALERRIFLWTTALQAHIEAERWSDWANNIPGFQGATYGFVPVSSQTRLPNGVESFGGYVFGVALEIEGPSETQPIQEAERFIYSQAPVALIFNRRQIELHVANPTYPRSGTGACWARSKRSAIEPLAADGILTAAHIVDGLRLGDTVYMDNGGKPWHLGDRGTKQVDAALIVKAGCIPATATRLHVQDMPEDGGAVTFRGAQTKGTLNARITHSISHPTYLADIFPMRVFMDKFGRPGDSGALVSEARTGRGVGVYIGRDPVPRSVGGASVWEGTSQFLTQAQFNLRIDLFN